jgi:UDP-N-acetylmuramate dehydrogenase
LEKVHQELLASNVGEVLREEPLAGHTTMKIGGPADLFIIPNSIESVKKSIEIMNKYKQPWTVIGRGSNLLVLDKGIEGVVIKLDAGLNHIEINDGLVRIGAGYSIVRVATLLSRQGLSGFEFAAGIPGSIGGAVYMNAGAHHSDISNILKRAHILFLDGTTEWLNVEDLEFGYRTSILQKKRPGICLEAEFQLTHQSRVDIMAAMKKNKEYRKETQPFNYPCAGSIFRNPLPNYAGNLVERAGLKGYQIGGAKVSDLHGNFIVNVGGATAQDVLKLISFIQKTVLDTFGIEIQTEVEIIGKK